MNLRQTRRSGERLRGRATAFLKRIERGYGKAQRHQVCSVVAVCGFLVLLVGALDFLATPGLSFSLLYLVPVALVTWLVSRKMGFVFTALVAIISLGGDLAVNAGRIEPYLNCASRLGVFVILVFLVSALRKRTFLLSETVAGRTKQLRQEIAQRRRVEHDVFDVLHQQKREMADELHDGLAQSLTALAANAKHVEEELRLAFSPHAEAALAIVQRLNEAVAQTREIARGMNRAMTCPSDLVSDLRRFASEVKTTFGIGCSVRSDLTELTVLPAAAIHLYRIVQQATDNAIRHGTATTIVITLEAGPSQYLLAIEDNGTGFDDAPASRRGVGLKTMQFRADLLGGAFAISSVPGRGTCVKVRGDLAALSQVASEEKQRKKMAGPA
jgi:signal transduction histidine kinase